MADNMIKEHGWNDPPMFSYSNLQSGALKKTHLTKRPTHAVPQTMPTDSNVLPSTPPTMIKPPTTSSSTTSSDEAGKTEERKSDVDDFQQVMDGLESQLMKHKDSLQSRSFQEIKRRLEILSKQWRDGGLSSHVQREMAKLTKALEDDDFELADKVHVSLMVDCVSEVSQWMVGIKRLIASLRTAQNSL